MLSADSGMLNNPNSTSTGLGWTFTSVRVPVGARVTAQST
jgi:hypothetical protein